MNAQISLSFRNVNFDITDIHGQPWLRSPQIAEALGYAQANRISDLYNRNADEFTDSMTQVIELPTAGGKQQVRVFSLRGCHLLGMLARTKVAKEFRRWVLDVLEKEVSGSPKTTADERTGLRQAVSALVGKCGIDYGSAYSMVHQRFGVEHIDQIAAPLLPSAIAYVHALTLQGRPAPQGICFSERQIHQFAVLTDYAERMMELLGQLEPALQALRSPLTARACSLADESFIWIDNCRRSLLATTISQYSGNTLPPAERISARRQ